MAVAIEIFLHHMKQQIWLLWRSARKLETRSFPLNAVTLAWWRNQMNTFSALLALCAGNSRAIGEFTAQRPVTRSFDAFFDRRLNKRLSKQSRGWWFETPWDPLWRHRNGNPPKHSLLLIFRLVGLKWSHKTCGMFFKVYQRHCCN